MHPSAAARVTAGNLEDDLGRLAEADWTIEAVVEDLEVKRGLLARAAAATRPGAILSSNTSTLTLSSLRRGAARAGVAPPPRHALLQPAALRAAARAGRPARRRSRCRRGDHGLRRGAPRQDGRHCRGSARLRREPDRQLLDPVRRHGRTRAGPDAWRRRMRSRRRRSGCRRPASSACSTSWGSISPTRSRRACAPGFRRTTLATPCRRCPRSCRRMIADGRTGRKGAGGFYRLAERTGRAGQGGARPRDGPLSSGVAAPAREPGGRDARTCGRCSTTPTGAADSPSAS